MSQERELSNFVREALKDGRPREEIRASLLAADWTGTEADAALAAWSDTMTPTGPVPRPIRSRAARDAFFYALLFVVLGMVTGNVLTLLFGQVNVWLPDPSRDRTYYYVGGLRWSMAALIVFTPAFWLLHRQDVRATAADPARRHGTIRRWLSALAMLLAVMALMGDALSLIYSFLDGQITPRFLAKSAIVAVVATVVLAYFRQERDGWVRTLPLSPAWLLSGLAVLSLGLSFWTVGGPAQGQREQRDSGRISDLRSLARDIRECDTVDHENLPETLDPLSCARNPQRLTALAADFEYHRLDESAFELCTEVEFPEAISQYDVTLRDDTACIRMVMD